MSKEAAGSASMHTWDLTCTDCSYEVTVEGEFLDALDVADEHQAQNGDARDEHFVDLQRNGHD